MWHCAYKFPFEYLILKDKDGNQIKTAFLHNKEELTNIKNDGDTIIKAHYKGCPHWNKPQLQDEFEL